MRTFIFFSFILLLFTFTLLYRVFILSLFTWGTLVHVHGILKMLREKTNEKKNLMPVHMHKYTLGSHCPWNIICFMKPVICVLFFFSLSCSRDSFFFGLRKLQAMPSMPAWHPDITQVSNENVWLNQEKNSTSNTLEPFRYNSNRIYKSNHKLNAHTMHFSKHYMLNERVR